MNYKSGNQYDGEWHANMKWGQGNMTYTTGEKYEGIWVKNLKEG